MPDCLPPTPRPWVLVVDDERLIRRSVRRVLERAGVAVMTVASAADAIRVSIEEPPALVLVDLHLSDMDGEELICRLRALHGAAMPPAVVVTGDADAVVPAAVAILLKPFDPGELLGQVHRHLPRAAA